MTRSLRLVFFNVLSICFVSALCYALLRYAMNPSDEFAAYNHPAQPWALDVHLLSSVGLTLVLGFLFGVHAWPRLAAGSNARASGSFLILLAALMLLSGALLPCSSQAQLRSALGWTHAISGTLFVLFLPWHIRTGRRAQRTAGRLAQGSG